MESFPSRLLSIFIAVFMAVVIPLSWSIMSDNFMARREIMNEVTMFIDEVIDTRKIDEGMLEDFYLGLAGKGMIIDVEISRYVRTVDPDPINGGTYTTYVYSDNIENFNQGDQIHVRVRSVGHTGAQKFVMATVGSVMPRFDKSFSGRVR